MKNQDLIIKMLLEKLRDIVNEMGGCFMKVHYMDSSKITSVLNDAEDFHDAVKVPILVGELSTTGNPSLLVFYVGISGYQIEMNANGVPSEKLMCSKKGSPIGDLTYPFHYFYNQCISVSLHVSRKKICDAITEKEIIIESNKEKKEYNGKNDTAMLLKFKTELVEFDQKFSKYKK